MTTRLVVLRPPEADPVSRFSVAPAPPPHGPCAACIQECIGLVSTCTLRNSRAEGDNKQNPGTRAERRENGTEQRRFEGVEVVKRMKPSSKTPEAMVGTTHGVKGCRAPFLCLSCRVFRQKTDLYLKESFQLSCGSQATGDKFHSEHRN